MSLARLASNVKQVLRRVEDKKEYKFDFTYLEQSACDGYKKGVSSKRVGEIATGRGGN
jgi:hypothetical protein